MIPLGRWYGIVLNLLLAALAVSGAAFFVMSRRAAVSGGEIPASTRLEIRDAVSGRVYGRWSLGEGNDFSLEFIHSVNQSPVRETFKAEKGRIRPTALRFFSFGAGMPTDLEEGQTLSRDGDALVITGSNRSFRELSYIVGTVSDHLLLVNGETISLRDLCGQNAQITIRVRP